MIICAKCGHEHPSDRIYDQTPCTCGNLITAFMTDAQGHRMSQDEYLARDAQDTSSLRHAE